VLTQTYLLSRFWVWSLVVESVVASAVFINAGWGTGTLAGMSGVPLRLLATLVTVGSVLLLRLAYVMGRDRLLLRIDESGITGREPSGDLWAGAVDFHIAWDQLAAVTVTGRLAQRVVFLDRHARFHTVSLLMVAGLRGGQGQVLAHVVRRAHAGWADEASD
jgi:hypothetical protein